MTGIDENNLLIFDPKSASIIFTVGEGLLTKSKKIIASLTQALILFSDKVVNQEISFIRFQNHRMVFIHEQDLYGVKLVPKDQLTKNFVPAIKIVLNLQNQLYKQDGKTKETANKAISILYSLIQKPQKVLFVFPESIEGYLSILTMMAALNYDLSTNLESIKKNFIIVKDNSVLNDIQIDVDSYSGLISFGVKINEIPFETKNLDKLEINLKDSIFNAVFPGNKSVFKLSSLIIGKESSSSIIAQIINREQSINEVALSLVKIPDKNIAVDIASEAITNFSKEQRLAKPLYRIIIKKLKDLEGTVDLEAITSISESIQPKTTSQPVANQNNTSQPETKSPTEEVVPSPPPISSVKEPQPVASGFSAGDFSSLANEFTSKLETLTKSEENTTLSTERFTDEETEIKQAKKVDFDSIIVDQNHFFMESFKIYFDFAPYRQGTQPEEINYHPSVQLSKINNEYAKFNVKIDPERQNWFLDICKTISETTLITFKGENGNFEIETANENLVDVLRVIIWSTVIDMLYSIQNGEMDLPDILNINNKSNLCIILDLTPERRKQLPSQIKEIIEEDKYLTGVEIEDQVKSFDSTLSALSSALKSKKGVGFVLRKNSKELALVLEFILTLSELCGIGWSRW